MKQTNDPFKILNRETTSVEELYLITLWSYKNVSLSEDNPNISKDDDGTLYLLSDTGEQFKKYSNRGHLKSDLFNKRIKELRSVLYVRLISALEVFLIDSIKYAFMKNQFILSSNTKRMEVPYSKLLSISSLSDLQWELVEKETRKLHSSGFKDVVKYYNTQMKINIAELGINLSKLEHFHDKRHLLVHKLGHTDSSYRHKYQEKNLTIKIDQDELIELINTIRDLSLKISTALEIKIANTTSSISENEIESKITFDLNVDVLPDILTQSYSFISKDKYLRNSDLFKIETIQINSKYAMHISCNQEDFKLIKRVLKRLERKDIINIKSSVDNFNQQVSQTNITSEHLETIAKILPEKSLWYQGLHKELGLILGISNSKASKILTQIIEEPNLLEILGTETHPTLDKC